MAKARIRRTDLDNENRNHPGRVPHEERPFYGYSDKKGGSKGKREPTISGEYKVTPGPPSLKQAAQRRMSK